MVRIQAPTLSNIVIDTDYIHYHRYALSPDHWDQLLERLLVCSNAKPLLTFCRRFLTRDTISGTSS